MLFLFWTTLGVFLVHEVSSVAVTAIRHHLREEKCDDMVMERRRAGREFEFILNLPRKEFFTGILCRGFSNRRNNLDVTETGSLSNFSDLRKVTEITDDGSTNERQIEDLHPLKRDF